MLSVLFLFVIPVAKIILMHSGESLFIQLAATVTCFIFLMGISIPPPPPSPHMVRRSSVPGVRKQAGCDTSLLKYATSYLQEFPVGRQVEASALPTRLPPRPLLLGWLPKGTEVTKARAILRGEDAADSWSAPRPASLSLVGAPSASCTRHGIPQRGTSQRATKGCRPGSSWGGTCHRSTWDNFSIIIRNSNQIFYSTSNNIIISMNHLSSP